MSRRVTIILAIGLSSAIALAVAGFVVPRAGQTTEAADAPDFPTVRVENRDLELEYEASGQLSPVSSIDVASSVAGTLVEVAALGSTVSSGSVLAVVDGQPVAVLDGEIPAWRDLGVGDEGPDVEQLERALVSAGFDPDGSITVDEEYTSATASIVEDWQESIGAELTGEVHAGAVVYLSEPMRVESVDAGSGSLMAAGDVVLGLASLDRVAVADVPVADAIDLAVGESVMVRLPDRTALDGMVASITAQPDTSARKVTVEFDTAESPGSLGAVDVDLLWAEIVAVDVPTLPATAFRKLDDGTYVVDVVNGGELTAVSVDIGRQLGSRVEVAGVPRDAEVVAP